VSHHLDTPLAAQTGQLYIDDLVVGTPAVYGLATRTGRQLADNAPRQCFRWSSTRRCRQD